MPVTFDGELKARIVEIRFALSGKVSSVSKHTGDIVKKWDLVASLDRKILQTELDSELSDYEKVRADFEIFGQKNPNPTEMVDKYLKTEKGAELNVSVKSVELAKARLDQADIFSPVNGVVLDDSNVVPGLYVTPASSSIKIIDTDSYYFEFEIDQKNIHDFSERKKGKVELLLIPGDTEVETGPILSDGKRFYIRMPILKSEGYLLGIKGKVTF